MYRPCIHTVQTRCADLSTRTDYTTATLPVYLLRCLTAISADFGIDPHRLCVGLGFNVGDLSNPQCLVSFRQASLMIQRAVAMAPGRDLGLRIGTSCTLGSFGLVGYVMLTSPTFGDAAQLGISMQAEAGSMLQLDLERDSSTLSIRATCRYHDPEIQAFLIEDAFGSFMRIGQALVGDTFQPSALDLRYEPPAYAAKYEQLFRCPVRFAQQANVFSCNSAWADKPIATYDPLSHRQALEFLQLKAGQEHRQAELIESIERIFRRDLRHPPVLAALANLLCMSDRTLRRRLAESRLSYQVVLDSARKQRALALLANPQLAIDEIAGEVGFSDARNFRRAFRKWTGRAPHEYRQKEMTGD